MATSTTSAIDAAFRNPSVMHKILFDLHEGVRSEIQRHPEIVFANIEIESRTADPTQKKTAKRIDLFAEDNFGNQFDSHVKQCGVDSYFIVGEESLPPASQLLEYGRFMVLCDILDGTDLVVKGFGNWCSAIVVADLLQKRIISSYVFSPDNTLYYALDSGQVGKKYKQFKGATTRSDRVRNAGRRPLVDVSLVDTVPSRPRAVSLSTASVCMYGQKPRAFSDFVDFGRRILAYRDAAEQEPRGPLASLAGRGIQDADQILAAAEKGRWGDFRIYNLGGNPMMAKMAEGHVDAVLEVGGQSLHDAVPGAFLALKSGCHMGDLEGNTITDRMLAEQLLEPRKRIKYILAGTRMLYDELRELVRPDFAAPPPAPEPIPRTSPPTNVTNVTPLKR